MKFLVIYVDWSAQLSWIDGSNDVSYNNFELLPTGVERGNAPQTRWRRFIIQLPPFGTDATLAKFNSWLQDTISLTVLANSRRDG